MYENNYNYINVPEDNNKPKKENKGGKTVALLLAAALVGGASGFGGSYLYSSLNTADTAAIESSAAAPDAPPASDNRLTVNPAADNSHAASTVNTLLSPASQGGELTTKQIVEKVSPSVVAVHSQFNNQGSATGTGIILSDEGYIITNAHVVQTAVNQYVRNSDPYGDPFGDSDYDIFSYFFGSGRSGSYKKKMMTADKVTVVLSGDEDTEYEAEVVGADETSDLAVLKIKDASQLNLIAAEFGDSNALTMGDKAVAIGYPLGLGLSTSEGIVSALNRTLTIELSSGGAADMTLIQTDAAINPGNSGGPLINGQGQVVGITSSKIATSTVEGLGFAIPISDAMPIISDLMNNGFITTPQIGITGSDVNIATARYYGLPVDKGVMIVAVSEGSGAEAAGLCEGDVIVAADGKEIASMRELTAAKSGKKVGDRMVLTIARANSNMDVTITLSGETPPETEVSAG